MTKLSYFTCVYMTMWLITAGCKDARELIHTTSILKQNCEARELLKDGSVVVTGDTLYMTDKGKIGSNDPDYDPWYRCDTTEEVMKHGSRAKKICYKSTTYVKKPNQYSWVTQGPYFDQIMLWSAWPQCRTTNSPTGHCSSEGVQVVAQNKTLWPYSPIKSLIQPDVTKMTKFWNEQIYDVEVCQDTSSLQLTVKRTRQSDGFSEMYNETVLGNLFLNEDRWGKEFYFRIGAWWFGATGWFKNPRFEFYDETCDGSPESQTSTTLTTTQTSTETISTTKESEMDFTTSNLKTAADSASLCAPSMMIVTLALMLFQLHCHLF
eukprot:m.345465 g.345465  ORF g.345465 m.345465 type:complete len:321 (+) comp26494_c0_seq1:243-1205(+)